MKATRPMLYELDDNYSPPVHSIKPSQVAVRIVWFLLLIATPLLLIYAVRHCGEVAKLKDAPGAASQRR
jgi:hypothetical protein